MEKSILNGDTWLGGAGYRWVGKGVRGVVGWGGVWGVGHICEIRKWEISGRLLILGLGQLNQE